MKIQQGFVSARTLIVIVLGLIVVGGGAYFVVRQQPSSQTFSKNSQNNLPSDVSTSKNTVSNQPLNTQTTPSATTPTSNNTVNWKTYTNNQFNFSLRYPPEFIVEENTKYLYGGQVLGVAFYSTNKQYPEIQLAVYNPIEGGQKLLGLNADKNGETFESASQKMQKLAKDLRLKYEVIQANGLSGFRLNPYGENTHETLILFGKDKDYVYLVNMRRDAGIDSSHLFNSVTYTGQPNKESDIFK